METSIQEKIVNIIIDLQERGFDHDFVLSNEYIRCLQFNELIAPDDFDIIEIYPCHGNIYFKNTSIIYGIELKKHNVKGILLSNYKSYIQGVSLHLWQKFSIAISQHFSNTNAVVTNR